jgi:hypothetical protein
VAEDLELVFRVHAVRRMFERRISLEDVRQVVRDGRPIEDYPDATPYPSRLMLGWCGSRPLHVVVADNPSAGEAIIVTVYEPDPARWEDGFTRRKGT